MRRATLVAALLATALGCGGKQETGIEIQVSLVGAAKPELQKLEVTASSPNGFDAMPITPVAEGVTAQTDAANRLVVTFDRANQYKFYEETVVFQLLLADSVGVTVSVDAIGRDDTGSVLLDTAHGGSATVVAGRMMVVALAMKCAATDGSCTPQDGGLAQIKNAHDAAHFEVHAGKPPVAVAVCHLFDQTTADLVVGIPTAQGSINSTSGGRVLVYRGKARDWSGELSTVAGTTGGPDITIVGDQDAEQLGATLACGPLSGGPLDDLVIGAPQADGAAGRVYVYTGGATASSGTTVGSPLPPVGDAGVVLDGGVVSGLAVLYGPAPDARAGAALVVARLGGTRPTLIVGAPGAHGGDGAVYFVEQDQILSPSGPPLGAGTGIELPGADGEALGSALAAGPLAALAPGTLDDVAIGAPGALAAATVGAVYVLPAAQTANVTDGGILEPTALKVLGPAGANVGTALAIGDFNKDGWMDLVVAAPTATFQGILKAGAVYVLKGDATFFASGTVDLAASPAPSLLRTTIGGQAASGFLGTSLAFAVSGAQPALRQGDLWLGAPGVQSNRGMALLVAGGQGVGAVIDTGAERAADPKILGVAEGDQLGKAVAAGILGNADSNADLVVTAPGVKENSVTAGVLYGIMDATPK